MELSVSVNARPCASQKLFTRRVSATSAFWVLGIACAIAAAAMAMHLEGAIRFLAFTALAGALAGMARAAMPAKRWRRR